LRKCLLIVTATISLLTISTCNMADNLHYGPTVVNDRLWQIANKVRPDTSVSKQQTMVALLKTNPSAFKARNVNGLRAGYVLTVPSSENIRAIDRWQALREIHQQNSVWKNQNNLAQTSDTTPDAQTAILAASPQQLLKPDASPIVAQIRQQLSAIQDQVQTTQQTYNQRLAAIESENNILKLQLAKLSTEVRILTQNQSITYAGSSKTSSPVFSSQALLLIGGLVASLFFMLGLWWWSHRSRLKMLRAASANFADQNLDEIDADTEDEYDYLNSAEGISAKLDLGRAYMEMGDTSLARTTLLDVVKQGNADQRKQAEELLDHLKDEATAA